MDSIKEIFDAFSQKLKSPFFGHITIAFVLWNWKVIYYVIYSGKPALMKFSYFDANVDLLSYVIPVSVGILTALASPYISNWGSLWASKPVNARRIRETQEASIILKEEKRLLAEREADLIGKAQRDVEVDQLPDGVREELQSQIDELRKKPFDISSLPSLPDEEKEIFDNYVQNTTDEFEKKLQVGPYEEELTFTPTSLDKKMLSNAMSLYPLPFQVYYPDGEVGVVHFMEGLEIKAPEEIIGTSLVHFQANELIEYDENKRMISLTAKGYELAQIFEKEQV